MVQPGVLGVESCHPGTQGLFDLGRISLPDLALGPIAVAVLRPFENLDQRGYGGSMDFRRFLQFFTLRGDSPDSSGVSIPSFIPQGVLGVSLYRVVPVSDVHRSARTKADINRYEAEVGGEDDVADIFLVVAELGFFPAMELDPVGGLVARLDVASLQLFGEGLEIDKLLPAGSRVGAQPRRFRVLFRIDRVERVKGLGVDRVTRHMLAPVVEGDAPGVGAVVGSEGGQAMTAGLETKPAAVLLANRAVGGLNLCVMEDRFAEDDIAIGGPDEVVQRVVGVLAAEAREDLAAVVSLAVTIGVLDKGEVRLLRDIDPSVAKHEAERDVEIIGEDRRLVGLSILIGVLQYHDLVIRIVARVDVRVGRRAAHPESTAGVPAHLDRAGELGEFDLPGEEVDLEAGIDLEGFLFVLGAHPAVGAAALGGLGQGRDIRVVDLLRHLLPLRKVPDPLVTVGDHDVKIAHGGQEVQVAIAAVAAAGVVEGVHRAVAIEELPVLFDDGLSQRFVYFRSFDSKHLSEESSGKGLVATRVEVHSVDGKVISRRGHGRLCRAVGVGVAHALG